LCKNQDEAAFLLQPSKINIQSSGQIQGNVKEIEAENWK
jgi:hypothetical protein